MSETQHCVSAFPASLLETHLALPNRVLEGGAYIIQPRRPFGLFCAAILLYDLRPLAARALTSRPGFAFTGGSLLASTRRAMLEPSLTKLHALQLNQAN